MEFLDDGLMEEARKKLVDSLADLGRAIGNERDDASKQDIAGAIKDARALPLSEAAARASQLGEAEVEMAKRRLKVAKAVVKAARQAEGEVATAKEAAARTAAEAKQEMEKAEAAVAAARKAAEKASSAAEAAQAAAAAVAAAGEDVEPRTLSLENIEVWGLGNGFPGAVSSNGRALGGGDVVVESADGSATSPGRQESSEAGTILMDEAIAEEVAVEEEEDDDVSDDGCDEEDEDEEQVGPGCKRKLKGKGKRVGKRHSRRPVLASAVGDGGGGSAAPSSSVVPSSPAPPAAPPVAPSPEPTGATATAAGPEANTPTRRSTRKRAEEVTLDLVCQRTAAFFLKMEMGWMFFPSSLKIGSPDMIRNGEQVPENLLQWIREDEERLMRFQKWHERRALFFVTTVLGWESGSTSVGRSFRGFVVRPDNCQRIVEGELIPALTSSSDRRMVEAAQGFSRWKKQEESSYRRIFSRK